MDVLARGDGLEADLDMRLWDREVEDDLDRRVGENSLDWLRGNAEFSGPRFRGGEVHVGERDDVEDRKCLGGLEIGRADVAAADHRDFDPVHTSSLNSIDVRSGAGPVVPHGAP